MTDIIEVNARLLVAARFASFAGENSLLRGEPCVIFMQISHFLSIARRRRVQRSSYLDEDFLKVFSYPLSIYQLFCSVLFYLNSKL